MKGGQLAARISSSRAHRPPAPELAPPRCSAQSTEHVTAAARRGALGRRRWPPPLRCFSAPSKFDGRFAPALRLPEFLAERPGWAESGAQIHRTRRLEQFLPSLVEVVSLEVYSLTLHLPAPAPLICHGHATHDISQPHMPNLRQAPACVACRCSPVNQRQP